MRYYTQNIQKKVTLLGFTSIEIFVTFLVLVLVAFLSYSIGGLFVTIVLVSLYILLIFELGKKIRKERRKGNPNYVEGLITSTSYPIVVTDKYCILKIIKNK